AQPEPEADDVWAAEAVTPSPESPEDDLIYQRMLSEWLVDPRDLAHSPDLDWQSVWDRGWSAAAEVESVPVQAHTEQGLPVRDPGARLVPGGAAADKNGTAHHRAAEDTGSASHGVRDPEAIRASMSSHFGGVRAGRSHARDTDQGPDHP
ncbi:MAG: ATP-binding protein, partial [Mycobacterium sp.]